MVAARASMTARRCQRCLDACHAADRAAATLTGCGIAAGLRSATREAPHAVEKCRDLTRCPASPSQGTIRVDPRLARGLSYYTGAIMEIAVPDLAGSLGGGGRYDNLIGMFLGRDMPACGFSLGLERIIVVMTEREMFPRRSRAARSTSWSPSG